MSRAESPASRPPSLLSITWQFDSPYAVSYWRWIDLGHDLDLLGSLDVIGHVIFNTHVPFPYRYSIINESLSPALFEIIGAKHIEVTTWTFQGHVTSTITWPFESLYAISYWWSFGTEPLYPTVFEIFGPNIMLTNDTRTLQRTNERKH